MVFKLRYLDFWPNFEPEDFVLTELLREKFSKSKVEIVKSHSASVDLEICSVFTFNSISEKARARFKATFDHDSKVDYICRTDFGHRKKYSSPARKRIWYTGENLRPPEGLFDGTISFDKSDAASGNHYFPLFYNSINWFPKVASENVLIDLERLVLPRVTDPKREFRACSFASNLSPNRQRLISIVNDTYPVDQFGASVGRFVASKSETSKKYLFQICNENSLYPGYVTEKLIQAWDYGNIPIWSGLLCSELKLNSRAFLDFTGLLRNEIHLILKNLQPFDIEELQTAPLMTETPSIEPLTKFFEKTLS